MEETELEEGEASFSDNDAGIDPDTLSYIDQRLQNVLGHFQKDFEGGCSAEILGPKYGGYGSFLPAYKQSPTVRSHTKTPQKDLCLEGAPSNSITLADVRPASHHTFLDQNDESARASVRKDEPSLRVSVGEKFLSKNENNTSNLRNLTEPRSLKVRIKVGSDKSLKKNAASAIYSGLGLLSPSSSTGNNPEDSGGTPSESCENLYDSPGRILRNIISIHVPGNRLLSPLNESLLCLKRTEKLEEKIILPIKVKKVNSSTFVDDSSWKPLEGKEVSSIDRNEVLEGMKYKNSTRFEGGMAIFPEKGTETEPLDSRQRLTNDVKVTSSLNSAIMTSESRRSAKKDIPVKKRETKKEWVKDKLFGDDLMSTEQQDVKHSMTEHIVETKGKTSLKKLSLDARESGKIKGNMVHSVCKNDPDVSKHETDSVGILVDRFEKKVVSKATNHEPHEVIVPPFERKNKLVGIQSRGISTKDKKSAQKDILKVRNSYKDILDTKVEFQNNQTKALEWPISDGAYQSDFGALKGKHVPINGDSADLSFVPQIEVAPAVPPDNWVGCDHCEKWRLLPIGIEPDHLPDKWLCSMSTWLPGRNHCDIGEDETTRAVQEMNLNLLSQNQNRLQCSGVASVDMAHSEHTNLNINSETTPSIRKNNKSKPENSSSGMIQTSHLKRKSSSETNQPAAEKNMLNKSIDMHPSKSSNFVVGKHAAKVNGGDLRPKKLKSKTGSDGFDYETHNKIKTEDAPTANDYRLSISVRRQRDSNLLDKKSSEEVAMHAKKRKLKDWQESQAYADTFESSEPKKLKISNTDVKESTANKSGKTMKIILSTSKDYSVDKRVTSRPNLNDICSSKKDLESEHSLFAATSSSSKVSDSCKRAGMRERKGSPVGSVSSSPTRALNQDKLSRKGHAKSIEIPRTLLPREATIEGHRSVQDLCNTDARQRSSGKVESKPKETFKIRNKRSDLQALDDANGAMTPQSSGKASSSRSMDNKDRKCSFQRVKLKMSDPLKERELFPNKMRRVEVDNPEKYSNESSAKVSNNEGKSVGKKTKSGDMVKKDSKKVFLGEISKKRDLNEVEVKGGKAEVKPSLEINGLDVQTFDGSGHNVPKILKNLGKSANQNAKSLTECGAMKNLGVISFVKEYASSQTAMSAFKRAEESKDYADRIKISGFDYECNDAYFDSALKFLYAASLLEACSPDFTKSKGVDQVHVSGTAAKLCKTCAQEYEKRKEMAAAALAYKCTEVAYMRVVYCKSLITKQDWQTTLQMVTQGESPSSSASDVDNLNHQATVDKTMLTKSIALPGKQVVARNQANFLRLLDFTSDVSLAMEASTNTRNAYAAASVTLDESQNQETINSVKRVVDFSFQDVKELVCLVQHALEAINRQGFRGNNNRNE